MRLETRRNLYYIMFFIGYPLIIFGIVKYYIDGGISLIWMILIITITTILHILAILLIGEYFKKKIKIRRTGPYRF